MTTPSSVNTLTSQKLQAFERLQSAFEESFPYVQSMHGQQRFSSFSVAHIVRYLHALWVCECKDRLLSVYKNITRYEGSHCLELLQHWQEGESADVIEFLNRKLDMTPFAELTRQIQEASPGNKGDGLVQRLIDGRGVLLNRGFNLMQALDAVFMLPEDQLLNEVRQACAQYGHRPDQIEQQLAEVHTPLYAYAPSQELAQRNMEVMNKIGVQVMSRPSDQPGERSRRVQKPTAAHGSFADYVVEGYMELTLPAHNNLRDQHFVDFPERSDQETI